MLHAIDPLSLVDLPIRPPVSALTVWLTLPICPLIRGLIEEVLHSKAMLIPMGPLAIVDLPRMQFVYAQAVATVLLDLTQVDGLWSSLVYYILL
jgi:hypothetical protein